MMKIITWNVNSIRTRLPNIMKFIKEHSPDVMLLQEIKVETESFPYMELETEGYKIAVNGQKSYNGVAILSKHKISDVKTELPTTDSDIKDSIGTNDQARYISAIINDKFQVASIYTPNGNPVTDENKDLTEKYLYKVRWLDSLYKHAKNMMKNSPIPFLIGGDYNIVETDEDIYDIKGYIGNALCLPEIRNKLQALKHLGLTDALRTFNNTKGIYSFWDYQRGSWEKDWGMLIDYLLLSPELADKLSGAGIYKEERAETKPSDHVPVWCEMNV
ncbi:MAG: exodeoxyribonuclease III [Alphaproteobacteria bacterium]|nr:exodeoxyribonuclease III [Alphaproteobacteria bacterium]